MKITPIERIDAPELADFTSLTDVALRRKLEPAGGLYLAESPKVIARALAAGHQPRAVLLLEQWLPRMQSLFEAHAEVRVYVGDSEQLEAVTGFHLHRGAIASMHRPAPLDPAKLLRDSRRLVVLEDLADHTNVGAVFRSVAALGADGVLLTPACADPLYRRSVRVSMGAVLQVPWARLPHWREAGPMIREAGYELAAFALSEDARDLADYMVDPPPRLAMMFGTEGEGLSRRALAAATQTITIPMQNEVDSLNVSTAAALALWAMRTADHRASADR